MSSSPSPRKPLSPHLQGLAGVLLGAIVVGVMLVLLHLRRDHLVVDPGELAMSETSVCIAQAIHQAQAGGHVITYAELDRLKAHCGS
ncbi:hypothetical protein [Metallibacterium scheffleri]|jgi:hypothetical protein|uniref:hypothetical protein n=1 Tax=Metallibacterium scheffleri TaxID=993689 RepID=UPI0026E9FED5|nr:hypothetical protein [Metallibacterium scheffleri]MBW8074748.1 hypothetical protein [Metallibacterium scheffleri]